MMRQMRENTKWIMLVTALAFFALMVFEWGMDASGASGGGAGALGRVNGTPVMFDDYQAIRRNLYDQLQASQDAPLTSAQDRELDEAAWEEAVNQILIQQELERRGITVTDAEVRAAAAFPPPDLRANVAFQDSLGQFDMQRYQQFLASVDEPTLLQLEGYYRDVIPRGKLMRQISSGLYIPDTELWRDYRDRNETVTVRYIAIDAASRIADSLAMPTERDITAYYNDNENDFAVPARASVQVSVISKALTPADSLAARTRADSLRSLIVAGDAEFADVARRESVDSGSGELGGDLGWFPQGRMTPVFDSAVFAAPVGEVMEPFRTQFGWHVLEVQERAADSARARHILIPIQLTEASELEQLTYADSLETLSERMTLAEAASILSLPVQQADLTEDFPFVTGAGQIDEGVEWALEEAEEGEVSPVFENDQAYYAIELQSVSEARTLSVEEARATIQQILLRQNKIDLAFQQAEAAVAAAGTGGMDQIATELRVPISTSEPFSRADRVPGLGGQNAAIGTAFGLNDGAWTGPIRTESGVAFIELVSRAAADSTAWQEQLEIQRIQRQGLLAQNRLELWLDGLRENARIVDNRDAVLNPVDEDDLPMGGVFGVGL